MQNGIVYWDLKVLPDITGRNTTDRLPILVSHEYDEQLLGIPKITTLTGKEIADTVYELLTDWNIENQVVACCFDTTPCNTGRTAGVALLLENRLRKTLLYFPCRHHIYELILRAAFESKFPVTSGKDEPLFKRFQLK